MDEFSVNSTHLRCGAGDLSSAATAAHPVLKSSNISDATPGLFSSSTTAHAKVVSSLDTATRDLIGNLDTLAATLGSSADSYDATENSNASQFDDTNLHPPHKGTPKLNL